MFQEHSRFKIWSPVQHILKHSLNDFAYTNPALAGVTSFQSALDWFCAVLYPNTKPAVANVAALPASGNTINDYRVVLDDGDGKQAGYRWEKREGEVSASWHKVFDFDWSTDSILAAFQDITQDLYVYQKGKSDLDGSGNVITGTYGGQKIYGGNVANQNLTLAANSGDGTGPHTGFVQVDDNFRPTIHNTYNLGTSSEAFRDAYIRGTIFSNTLTITAGSITDSSGTINFGSTNLTTTGNVTGTQVKTGTLTISDGSIQDTDGAITFGTTNLSTSGTITAAANSSIADFTFTNGSITSASATISFGSNNLSTTGTLGAGNTTVTRLDSGNVRITGNTVSVLNSNGNLIVQANGTGIIDLQSAVTTVNITTTGINTITGQFNADNLRLDGNVISSTNLNGNITLTPNGTGDIETSARVLPASDASNDLGALAKRYTKLFLSSAISNGTTEITQATLQSLRDINVGATAGMTIFYDGSKWNASIPDSEITHGTLTGLTTGDAGHTQFVMLAGRTGGQTIQGGQGATENLVLESTSNASKGSILVKDKTTPFTDASFSGSWSGTDLGDSTHFFRDLYTKGELKNGRAENFLVGSLPSSSAQNVGRMAWATDTKKLYVDNGSAWQVAGSAKYATDQSFDGVQTTLTATVSSQITDARQAIWQLLDNANNFERIYTTIRAISATQVQIVTNAPLPAGSYRLIGIE